MEKLWGGRFKGTTDKVMERFNASIRFDSRLYAFDIQGSIAYCKMLAKCKIIKPAEEKKIISSLPKEIKSFFLPILIDTNNKFIITDFPLVSQNHVYHLFQQYEVRTLCDNIY